MLMARNRPGTARAAGREVRVVRRERGERHVRVLLRRACGWGGTHTAPRKYHDEIISLVFIHTKYGEPIVIMVFRRAIQTVLCLSPPAYGAVGGIGTF
jgi:hypothetical protein